MEGQLKHLPPSENKEATGWPWDQETDPSVYSEKAIWPKISIVTPSYNQGRFIEATIRSVLLQNYPNLEYIIIDGGSTDETLDILHKYQSGLSYWISEPDAGQSSAINKGIQKSGGAYFNWLNSDDYLEKDALFHLARQIEPNTTLIAGYCKVFDDASGSLEMTYRLGKGRNSEETMVDHTMCQPSMFYRSDIIREGCGVEESLHYTMDLALFIRYVSTHGQNNIRLIDQNISYFRKHEDSKTVRIQEKFEEEERQLYAGLLLQSGTAAYQVERISLQPYQPQHPWKPRINQQEIQQLVYRKFILRKAQQAYAQSDYPNMRKYTRQYLSGPTRKISPELIKLMVFSFLIPKTLLISLRSVYGKIIHRKP